MQQNNYPVVKDRLAAMVTSGCQEVLDYQCNDYLLCLHVP